MSNTNCRGRNIVVSSRLRLPNLKRAKAASAVIQVFSLSAVLTNPHRVHEGAGWRIISHGSPFRFMHVEGVEDCKGIECGGSTGTLIRLFLSVSEVEERDVRSLSQSIGDSNDFMLGFSMEEEGILMPSVVGISGVSS